MTDRLAVFVGGGFWAFVYNLLWALAWFAFMRQEWIDAMASAKRSSPWTVEVWVLWVVLTLPIGIALAAYAANRSGFRSILKATLLGSLTLWLVMTVGMAGWAWSAKLSLRVIALDSVVNLVALAAASFASAWISQRRGRSGA